MEKYELTKTIEARKLNKRTLRPVAEYATIPFGAILENVTEEHDQQRFYYLGEPYEFPLADLKGALHKLE